jgi:hypothetical protein
MQMGTEWFFASFRAWPAVHVLAALVALIGCQATIPESRFRCVGPEQCPDDWYCVDGHCQSTPGTSLDGGPEIDGAMSPDGGPTDGGDVDAPVMFEDGGGRCTSPAECDDMNPCTIDVCMGTCGYAFEDDGTDCDDGVACNGADTCMTGVCEHARPPCTDCNDGNACTWFDAMVDGVCMGDAAAAHHSLCGACDGSGCRMCCNGACQNVNENAYCAGCDSPCSGGESCRYDPGRPCAWLWCCGT